LASRPIIGVTGPTGRFVPAWWFTRYALRRAGARPVRLTAETGLPAIQLDGVIIGGGADIAPGLYDELLGGNLSGEDPERDAFEMSVLREALRDELPVLGICRGAQLLNVVLGGSLHRDLRQRRRRTSHRRNPWPCKPVAIRRRSLLERITGKQRCRVNSLHNQAVRRLGQHLQITARDRDGIVQAIEYAQGFVLGVQWHPEYLPYRRDQRALFAALVAATRAP
jgi:putative glutamine amidotransferase